MASDSELKNLGEALQVTLGNIQDAGIYVGIHMDVRPQQRIDVAIVPFTICNVCQQWSPADQCLWCEPEEYDGAGTA